jgi:hypothetical protein
MITPRNHVRASEVAKRLGHSRRWVLYRIADGTLEGFQHARNDVTVSLESVVDYEDRIRMSPASTEKILPLPDEVAG